MGSAQLLFSQILNYPWALLACGLLGCGDAMVTLTIAVGAAGNAVATVPLTFMLTDLGWGPAFAIAGGLSLAYGPLLLRPAAQAPAAMALLLR